MVKDAQDLDKPGIQARFDPETRIIFVTYAGELSSDITQTYYRWMGREIAPLVDRVRGMVVDFQQVKHIPSGNAITVLHASRSMQLQMDISHVMIALLVRDLLQEQLVRIAANMTRDQHNKKIVYNMADALAFIDGKADPI